MFLLETAKALAYKYHEGQTDKAGNPYILHPEAVAARGETEDEEIVGWLHDLLEDTEVTREMLFAMGFPQYIVEAVEAMSRQEGETYMEFIRRVKKNTLAAKVKNHDLDENMLPERIAQLPPESRSIINRYTRAKAILAEED